MDEKESENGRTIGSVRAAINKYGGKASNSNSQGTNLAQQKFQKGSPDTQKMPSKASELHLAKKRINRINEGTEMAEREKSQAELELLKAKNKVRELTLRIEESKLKAKERSDAMRVQDQLKPGAGEAGNLRYAEVEREVETLRRELSKLKLDMARAIEEKARAEKEAEDAGSRLRACLRSAEELRREIEEANEEEVLVELAQIQARKELASIEAQRREDAEKFLQMAEAKRKDIGLLRAEIEGMKGIEEKLAVVNSDIEVMQELKLIKEMDIRVGSSIKSKNQKLPEYVDDADKELDSFKGGGFEIMSSIDGIRDELDNVLEEKAQMEEIERQTEKVIKNLNSKLLRARDKLEYVSASENKAKSMLSSLSVSLEKLEREKEAVRKEKQTTGEENRRIRAEIQKAESDADLTEEKLSDAMDEIAAVKSAEAKALKRLKALVEKAVKSRASKKKSTITISRFEYDYLVGHAVGAQEVADKKVRAANAWTEALKASEKEMKVKIELAERKLREVEIQEEQEVTKLEKLLLTEEKVEEEMQNERRQSNKSLQSRSSVNEYGLALVPVRQAKFRRSSISSQAARRLSGQSSTIFTMKKRTRVMLKIAKYFASKQIAGGKKANVRRKE